MGDQLEVASSKKLKISSATKPTKLGVPNEAGLPNRNVEPKSVYCFKISQTLTKQLLWCQPHLTITKVDGLTNCFRSSNLESLARNQDVAFTPGDARHWYIDSALPLDELQLIDRIRRQAKSPAKRGAGARVVMGIGDDTAALAIPAGHETLVTTDFSLEVVHFRREWHAPVCVGHRCLTRGLSDIAAMGGDPVAAFLSLALPEDLPQRWVGGFFDGLLALAAKHGVVLAGGDIAQSPAGVLADIMVVGSVPEGKAILRSGARPGDHIFVTGDLGAASAMLERMYKNPRGRYRSTDCPAHFLPEPQLAVGRYLREKAIATSMIDISDGLSSDLAHICDESGVRAEIQAETVPLGTVGRHEVSLDQALHGGDEYELLFTAPPNKRVPGNIAGVTVTHIGYIEEPRPDLPKMLIFQGNNAEVGYELRPGGWRHFKQTTKARSGAPAPRRQR